MATGVNNCAEVSANPLLHFQLSCIFIDNGPTHNISFRCIQHLTMLGMLPGRLKEAKIVAESLIANRAKDFNGNGRGGPTPNIVAKHLSFKTLNVTLAQEEAINLG